MMNTIDLTEGMQVLRLSTTKKATPSFLTKTQYARQATASYTKTNTSDQRGQCCTECANSRFSRCAGINGHNQEYGCT